jgi:sucrose-phosphate synthase
MTALPNEQDDPTHAPEDGLTLFMFSVHGLIRGHDLELGCDADTGGQVTYVVELARALGRHERLKRVVLFTRLIDDDRVSSDYAQPQETLGEGAEIVRIKAGGGRYRRKETLWPYLDEFVKGVLQWTQQEGVTPDLVHGHYADAGYVAMELATALKTPLVFTGHSLGRNKVEVLKNAGLSDDAIESRYHAEHRIGVEEDLLKQADLVIASTDHEVERGYALYEQQGNATFQVLPPGTDVRRFYPWYHDQDEAVDVEDAVIEARVRVQRELDRFLTDANKPLILAISRPDKRKNIDGLVTAYGEDQELQQLANLAVFAGVRKDIESMSDNEREVLTDLLLRMDRYDLYGRLALPKKHDPDTDIPVLYRLAAARHGVFINPALVENFGITVIEASASGLPVVTTDHGGPKDILAHCDSGILVDATDTAAIQTALKKLLTDREAWDRHSRNGIAGVRKHYSWRAHVDRYLEALQPLLDGAAKQTKAPKSARNHGLATRDFVLISDIDGTLVDGEPNSDALAALAETLERRNMAFGLASGRRLALVEEAIQVFGLPEPAVLIADVGTDIRYGRERRVDRGFQRHIDAGFKPQAIRERLNALNVTPQPDENQSPRKLSYVVTSEDDVERIKHTLAEARLAAHVVWSHGRYLDVIPSRAGKGKAIDYLVKKWRLDPSRVAVAGDSGNDLEMLNRRYYGIVVGNHHPELSHLRGKRKVFFASKPHALGVQEGLARLGWA